MRPRLLWRIRIWGKCIQRVYERHQKSFENACKTDWYLSACWRWILIYTNAKKRIAFSKKEDKSYKILMFSEKQLQFQIWYAIMKTVHAWIKRITLRKRCFWFCVCRIQKVKGKPVQFWYDLVTVIGECSVIDVTVERWEDHGIMLILESGNLPFFVQESRFQITRHWSYRNTFEWCLFRYAFGSFWAESFFISSVLFSWFSLIV